MADFFTWVGRAAHGGHAVRTLSREGDAATVTRRRTDVPQWYQGAGMNGSDLEKNRDPSRHDVPENETSAKIEISGLTLISRACFRCLRLAKQILRLWPCATSSRYITATRPSRQPRLCCFYAAAFTVTLAVNG